MNPLLNHFKLIAAGDLTTLKTGGYVWAVEPKSVEQLKLFVTEFNRQNVKYMPVGGGSNLVVADKPKTVAVLTRAFNLVEVRGQKVYVGAGARLKDLVSAAQNNGLSGVEFLAGIPASFGGALKMNAGAFSSETMDKVLYIDVLTDKKVERVPKSKINWGYRHTDVDGIILGGALFLDKSSPENVLEKTAHYLEQRRRLQPSGKSCGSVFKKADGVSAGKLLEQVGLKGKRCGGMVVSDKHANFFLNDAFASTSDFLRLAALAEDAVFKRYGIKMEREFVYFE